MTKEQIERIKKQKVIINLLHSNIRELEEKIRQGKRVTKEDMLVIKTIGHKMYNSNRKLPKPTLGYFELKKKELDRILPPKVKKSVKKEIKVNWNLYEDGLNEIFSHCNYETLSYLGFDELNGFKNWKQIARCWSLYTPEEKAELFMDTFSNSATVLKDYLDTETYDCYDFYK